jgi:hypothetical protein
MCMETSVRAMVRSGDRKAFSELFGRYAKAIYNRAFRLTADWSIAEDIMSAPSWRLCGCVGASIRARDPCARGSWASPPTSPGITCVATDATAPPWPRWIRWSPTMPTVGLVASAATAVLPRQDGVPRGGVVTGRAESVSAVEEAGGRFRSVRR